MSSWYVWAALGMYPEIPGRAELLLGSPLFPRAVVHGGGGDLTTDAPGATTGVPYVRSLRVDGQAQERPWLSPELVAHGGHLHFTLGQKPNPAWGSATGDAPPSFAPPRP